MYAYLPYLGDKTVQCGRKSDAFKLWLMWKARGDEGVTDIVDRAYDNARSVCAYVSSLSVTMRYDISSIWPRFTNSNPISFLSAFSYVYDLW